MIAKFKAENYGCLRNVEVDLTPIHAFIGPNDSGKSTLLRAIRTVVQLASGGFWRSHDGVHPFDPLLQPVDEGEDPTVLEASVGAGRYRVEFSSDEALETVVFDGREYRAPRAIDSPSNLLVEDHRAAWPVVREIGGVVTDVRPVAVALRLDTRALRQATALIPEHDTVTYFNENGLGLPAVYDAILGRGDDAFQRISNEVRRLFPTVKNIRIPAKSASTKTIETDLLDGTRVPTAMLSDGLLVYLAIAALPYLAPSTAVFIEEPENGLHPARVADVIRLLREFTTSSGTQVLIATHSPLVIDELSAQEVTVLTRPSLERGTQAIPIQRTHNFQERAGVYNLGDLWLSYCDGEQEEPLFNPRLR